MTEMTNPTEASERTPLTDALMDDMAEGWPDRWIASHRDLERALTAAKAELATKSEDAERYRWLREAGKTGGQEGGVTQRGVTIVNGDKVVLHFVYWTTKEGFDAAIDAARKESHEQR